MSVEPFERLGSQALPVNYVLKISPDLNAFKFKGSVEIHVKVRKRKLVNCRVSALKYCLR